MHYFGDVVAKHDNQDAQAAVNRAVILLASLFSTICQAKLAYNWENTEPRDDKITVH